MTDPQKRRQVSVIESYGSLLFHQVYPGTFHVKRFPDDYPIEYIPLEEFQKLIVDMSLIFELYSLHVDDKQWLKEHNIHTGNQLLCSLLVVPDELPQELQSKLLKNPPEPWDIILDHFRVHFKKSVRRTAARATAATPFFAPPKGRCGLRRRSAAQREPTGPHFW